MSLLVICEKTVDNVQMGVFGDGTPFLTQGGLALLCGVTSTAIRGWRKSSSFEGAKQRGLKMVELLSAHGFEGANLYEEIVFNGQDSYAYPDSVCMAFLEYYAFEAGDNCRDEARQNYRILARGSLRRFIYQMTGYDPDGLVPIEWQQFHDRMLLNPVPMGYFSIFREIADIVVAAIREGLVYDSRTVPDISVGQAWSKYWKSNGLENRHGSRVEYPHQYPDYFPQSLANDRIKPFLYPVGSLGEFREWIYSEYLPAKFPNYLKRKVKQGLLPPTSAELLIKAVQPPELLG